MLISVVQTAPTYLRTMKNRTDMVQKISTIQSDLIIFPELCTSGYNFQNSKELARTVESFPNGPTPQALSKLSREKKCTIVAGFPEVHRGRYYNSAVIAINGKLDVYRKIHLFWKEKRFFSSGSQKPKIYKWKNLKFGVMICFDWIFPEMARTLALQGADLLVHPSNLVLPYAPQGMKVRSLENHVFSATANRVGKEFGLKFIGQSQILGVRGEIKGKMGPVKIGTLTREIHVKEARNKYLTPKNHLLKDRKVRLYF